MAAILCRAWMCLRHQLTSLHGGKLSWHCITIKQNFIHNESCRTSSWRMATNILISSSTPGLHQFSLDIHFIIPFGTETRISSSLLKLSYLASPGHQLWNWLGRIDISLFSMRFQLHVHVPAPSRCQGKNENANLFLHFFNKIKG